MALHQVAGHAASFFANPDPESSGSSLIKSSCPIEREFYTQLGLDLARSYSSLLATSTQVAGGSDGAGEGQGGRIERDQELGGEFEFVGVWTPAFFGVLTLNSSTAPLVAGSSEAKLATEPCSESPPPEVSLPLCYRTESLLTTI